MAGCGDDEEDSQKNEQAGPTTAQTQTQTAPKGHGGDPPPAPGVGKSPEDQPGGAGDEEPARAPAVFTGLAGSVGPSIVRVPPFIAVRVELRSADGGRYALRLGDKTVRAGPGRRAGTFTHPGLRQGEALKGRQVGGDGGAIRIEASAEPGP